MILQNITYQSLNARLHIDFIQQIFLRYDACRRTNIIYIVQGRCSFRHKGNDFNVKEKQRGLLIITLITTGDGKANDDFSENCSPWSRISERKAELKISPARRLLLHLGFIFILS